jgi:UDPglucose 6-dehydrogenase
MNFVFEDINLFRNLAEHWVDNNAGSPRFTVSPIFNRLNTVQYYNDKYKGICNIFSVDEKPEKYIIPIGVNNDPHNWAGGTHSEFENYPSLFEFLSQVYLEDLRKRNAFLIIDSSFEGYHEDWVFNYFYDECDKYGIHPNQIFFVTGNQIVDECYEKWLISNPKKDKINAVPYTHFEFDCYTFSLQLPPGNSKSLPLFDDHLNYKKSNLDEIKTYCNLNKKPRSHRVNFYTLLYLNELLDKGLVSMEDLETDSIYFCDTNFDKEFVDKVKQTLPSRIYGVSNEIYDPGYYITRFNDQITLDTWISVISEAQYWDSQETVFLSEKIFKVMACSHPFMILGNKRSLDELKQLGYKTFDKWLDESYDNMTDCDRFYALIENIKKIDSIEDKLSWFSEMKDIIEYNKNRLKYNSIKSLPPAAKIILNQYYDGSAPDYDSLKDRLLNKQRHGMKVGFIGIGKLGKEAVEVISKRHHVITYDIQEIHIDGVERMQTIEKVCQDREIIFIAVPTPHDPAYDGRYPSSHLPNKDFDYSIVKEVLAEVDKYTTKDQLVVLISTVLPGTIRREFIPLVNNFRFIYNPYLIAMGTVKEDMVTPEMIIIGTEDGSTTGDAQLLIEFYETFIDNGIRYEVGTWDEAEAIKIFYNTFISTKVALVNMIQDVAQKSGNMNVDVVTGALERSTQRIISPAYMKAGMGDGGGCHPRDNIALRYMAEKLELGYDIFDSIMNAREKQAKNLADVIIKVAKENNLPVNILGKSYKPGVSYEEGSTTILTAHYVSKEIEDVVFDSTDRPAVYLLGHRGQFNDYQVDYPSGSYIIDVWREFDTPRDDIKVLHYGNTR